MYQYTVIYCDILDTVKTVIAETHQRVRKFANANANANVNAAPLMPLGPLW